jgi:hypothetical protein
MAGRGRTVVVAFFRKGMAMNLISYLGRQILGVLAYYEPHGTVVHICGVYPLGDDRLRLYFPKGHRLSVDDRVTLHLDNRSGVDEFDADIRVYRASYKGRVIEVEEDWAVVAPRECLLMHGMKPVLNLREPGYTFPGDPRPENLLPLTPLWRLPPLAGRDHPNKIGVLITHAHEQPHTTVLAFLSSENDDIFLITFPETFKSRLLKRDPHCFFVMDERAAFTFERAIEWNYTIIEGDASIIPNDAPLFEAVREAFIEKNPWEIGFFVRADLEMYHIKRRHIVCPGSSR